MRKYILAMLFSLPFFVQAQEKTLPSGLKYTLFTRTEGKTITQGSVVTMQLEERTAADSLLFSSREAGRPIIMQYTGHDAKGDLREVFPLLKAGDSVQIKVPVDSMDLPPFDQRPPFLKPGATLVYRIAVKKIQTVEEANAERESAANRRHEEELAALDRFLDTKKIQVKKAPDGLRYYIRDSSERKKPVPGDTVWVNYIGRTLQDKVFDSSIENVALRANLKQPGRIYVPFKFVVGEGNVIPGWEKAVPFFAEGNKISVFIPSKFAYGEQGAGADIPPNATLWFDIDLVKVHPKQEPVVKKAPVKKAPLRKAPVKKPAVKAPVKKG